MDVVPTLLQKIVGILSMKLRHNICDSWRYGYQKEFGTLGLDGAGGTHIDVGMGHHRRIQ